ncbi:PREDICTED: cold shock domain-containing protein C2 [Pygoscelis adeliae]|uniref:cold shock domain-containing protein C2 n=1 Tax=Pygoscelis adeliae TaxID=9238 RepID=UPI0004F4EF9A|nr:PREDICTED: cold shock domain-containing protein C2 [Pygoscelis adeliae]
MSSDPSAPPAVPPLPSPKTARASAGPIFKGVCKQFSRSQGHGFITPENGTEDIFVHVSE